MANVSNLCRELEDQTLINMCGSGYKDAIDFLTSVSLLNSRAVKKGDEAKGLLEEISSVVDKVVAEKEDRCSRLRDYESCGFLFGIERFESFLGEFGSSRFNKIPKVIDFKNTSLGYIVMSSNESPYQEIVFDTGAGMSVFSPSFIDENRSFFTYVSNHEDYDIGIFSVQGLRFMLGEVLFMPTSTASGPVLDHMEGTTRDNTFIGIAGQIDFAAGHVVEINYDKHQVIIDQDTVKRIKEDKWEALPLRMSLLDGDLKYIVYVDVNGIKLPLLIDTGSSGCNISPHCVNKIDLSNSEQTDINTEMISGSEVNTVYSNVSIVIGANISFKGDVAVKHQNLLDTDNHDKQMGSCGILGLPALKKMNFIIDPVSSTLFVQPRKTTDKHGLGIVKHGLNIIRGKNGNMVVKAVILDSLADKKGIKEGDEIISINGVPSKDISIYEQRNMEIESDEPMVMVLKRDSEIITFNVPLNKK